MRQIFTISYQNYAIMRAPQFPQCLIVGDEACRRVSAVTPRRKLPAKSDQYFALASIKGQRLNVMMVGREHASGTEVCGGGTRQATVRL